MVLKTVSQRCTSYHT